MRKNFYSILILLVFLFTSMVAAQPTSPPILYQPSDYATNVSLFPTFSWSTVPTATYYKLRIYTGPVLVYEAPNITSTSFNLTAQVLTGNTFYYWTVCGANSGGEGPFASYFHFTTTVAIPPQPVLTYPPNNATDVSLTPTLDWEDVNGASSYSVQVSTSPSFGTNVVNISGITNSSYAIPNSTLSNSTTYYWRVNASNAGGTSLWSDPWSFTTIPALPAPPQLVSPTNNSTNVTQPVTLNWNDVATATGYRAQVSLNDQFTQIVFDELSTVSQIVVPAGTLSGTTMYYWRVNASNVAGYGQWSSIWHFTTAVAPPAAPLLYSPLDGQTGISISGTVFDWATVPTSTAYRIQISTDSTFATTFINQLINGNNNSQFTHSSTYPVFSYNTKYFWRVNASNTGGTGIWSQVWDFTTVMSTLPAPSLISPPNGATNVPLTPFMDWSDVPGATGYRLQISTSPSFTSYVLNVNTIQSDYTVPSGILQGFTTYYWRVASINEGGTGANSVIWNFQTLQTFNLNLKVYLEGFFNGTSQVSDTIQILLARNISPFDGRDTSLAVLNTSGQVSSIGFARATSGNYYIVVKHRNHLETWSANAMYFSTGNTVNYDFTNDVTKAYGNNMKQVGTVWVLYGGDGNHDGFINSADYELFKTQFGMWGYLPCDYNGDWFVDGYDLPVQNNFGHSVIKPQ